MGSSLFRRRHLRLRWHYTAVTCHHEICCCNRLGFSPQSCSLCLQQTWWHAAAVRYVT